MFVLKTIRDAFSFNLKLLRGSRTQAEMAEFLSIPLRTYQKIETGTLPTGATMEAVTQKLGVDEISLVQLPIDARSQATIPQEKGPKPLAPDASKLALFGAIVTRLSTFNEVQLRFIEPAVEVAVELGDLGHETEAEHLKKNQA